MLSRSNRGTRWSKGVFEWRMSIGSEVFSLFICFDANKFVLLSFFTMTEATCAKFGQNHRPIMQKVHFRSTCVVQKRYCLSFVILLRVLAKILQWRKQALIRISLKCSRTFIILRAWESLTSFNKNNRVDFSSEKRITKLSGMSS